MPGHFLSLIRTYLIIMSFQNWNRTTHVVKVVSHSDGCVADDWESTLTPPPVGLLEEPAGCYDNKINMWCRLHVLFLLSDYVGFELEIEFPGSILHFTPMTWFPDQVYFILYRGGLPCPLLLISSQIAPCPVPRLLTHCTYSSKQQNSQ